MALKCVCHATQQQQKQNHQQHHQQQSGLGQDPRSKQKMPTLRDIDMCKIKKRTEDPESQHNDYSCHLKGEKNQNLINKIKMFLDNYDDRPVMKRKGDKEEGKALGQSGFGPMIKYPGYVDYDHPYFSSPYNKMPELAMTVGQRNICPPDKVRNFDSCRPQGPPHASASSMGHHGGGGSNGGAQGGDNCQCAQRRGADPRCRVAGPSPSPPGFSHSSPNFPPSQGHTSGGNPHPHAGVVSTAPDGRRFICIPLPDN